VPSSSVVPIARAPSSPRTEITKMESATSASSRSAVQAARAGRLLGAAAADAPRPAGARASRARGGSEYD
jgi:hypothetical protein